MNQLCLWASEQIFPLCSLVMFLRNLPWSRHNQRQQNNLNLKSWFKSNKATICTNLTNNRGGRVFNQYNTFCSTVQLVETLTILTCPKVPEHLSDLDFILSKVTSLTCVRAEHSTYLTAFRSRASFSAVSGVIGFCLFFASFSMVDGSSLKSICVPTSRKGVFGQWWVISGTHWEQNRCSSVRKERQGGSRRK